MAKTHIMNKSLQWALITAVLLIGFSVFYYLVIFTPQANTQRLEQKIQLEGFDTYKEVTTEQKLEDCLNEISNRVASDEFQNSLKKVNVTTEVFNAIMKVIESKKEDCYKTYGK